MPHLVVNIWPGRTDKTKTILANRLAKTAAKVLKMDQSYVSVSIHEIPEDGWDEFIKREVNEKLEEVFKLPGEPPESL